MFQTPPPQPGDSRAGSVDSHRLTQTQKQYFLAISIVWMLDCLDSDNKSKPFLVGKPLSPKKASGARTRLLHALMIKPLDVPSNAVFVTGSTFGLDLSSHIKASVCTILIFNLSLCLFFFLETQWGVPEASQQQVKVERLCGGREGPDCPGTGSVSGFRDWWLVAKAVP